MTCVLMVLSTYNLTTAAASVLRSHPNRDSLHPTALWGPKPWNSHPFGRTIGRMTKKCDCRVAKSDVIKVSVPNFTCFLQSIASETYGHKVSNASCAKGKATSRCFCARVFHFKPCHFCSWLKTCSTALGGIKMSQYIKTCTSPAELKGQDGTDVS